MIFCTRKLPTNPQDHRLLILTLLFDQGKTMPSVNMPSNGPPIMPIKPIATVRRGPSLDATKAIPMAKSPYRIAGKQKQEAWIVSYIVCMIISIEYFIYYGFHILMNWLIKHTRNMNNKWSGSVLVNKSNIISNLSEWEDILCL